MDKKHTTANNERFAQSNYVYHIPRTLTSYENIKRLTENATNLKTQK